MKRIIKFVTLLSMLSIFVLSYLEYAYSAPDYVTQDYQALIINGGGSSPDELKNEIEEMSNKYQSNIIYKERKKSVEKNEYTYYYTLNNDKFWSPKLFNDIKWENFDVLEPSKLIGKMVYIEKNGNEDKLINDLRESGIDFELKTQSFQTYFITKDSIKLILLTMFLNLITILIYHNSLLKEYSIKLLEGNRKSKIIYDGCLGQMIVIAIVMVFTIVISLVVSAEIYFIRVMFKYYVLYMIGNILINVVVVKSLLKRGYNTYMKNHNGNSFLMYFLMICRFFVYIGLILTIPLLIALEGNQQDLEDKIKEMEPYDDVVVSEIYDSSNVFTDEEVYKVLSEYYTNTVEKYNGIIYQMKDLEVSSINYNILNDLKIVDVNGIQITTNDLSDTVPTILVPESSEGLYIGYPWDYEVKVISDGQKFLSSDLGELDKAKKVEPSAIIYYPQNLESIVDSNVVPLMTSREYFLTVKGDNKFDQLKPVIDASGADGLVISTPSVTVEYEERLLNVMDQTRNAIYLILIYIIMSLLMSTFIISAYIKSEGKSLVVKCLEGTLPLVNFKIIYVFMLMELAVGVLMALFNSTNIITVIVIIVFELVLNNVLIRINMKNKLVSYLKGDV